MAKKGKLNKISNDLMRSSIGVFICLFMIYLSLNLVRVSQYDYFIYLARAINYVVSFFVGGIFSYVIYVMVFIYGIRLILPKSKKSKGKWALFIVGVVLFLVGGMIIFANTVTKTNTEYLTFNNYGEDFYLVYEAVTSDTITGEGLLLTVYVDKNPGIIGYSLTALLNTIVTDIGSYVIGSIIFVSGLVMLLIKPCSYLWRVFNDYRNFNYKYSPKNAFTKAKDLTLTTTTIESLEDSDSLDIRTSAETEITEEKEITQEDYIARFDRNSGNKNRFISDYENTDNRVDNYVIGSHFEDTPLTKARYNPYGEEKENVNKQSSGFYKSARLEIHIEENNLDSYRNSNKSISEINKDYQMGHNRLENPVDQHDYAKENKYRELKGEVLTTPTFDYLKDIEKENSYKSKRVRKRTRYIAPATSLLEARTSHESDKKNQDVAEERRDTINEILTDLDVRAKVVHYQIGPSVTRYDIQTEKKESIKGFDSYLNDICIRLGGINARFTPVVLGKTTSGLEIANAICSIVNFKDCLEALNRLPKSKPTNIPFGKDINNKLLSVDLMETPHLLVSGTTGSGKSIFVHSLIMTLIMRNSPDNLKLLLVDPKTVEFTKYREIPHLLCPPIGLEDPQTPYEVLLKVCEMMEERYRLFAETDCTKLKEYNEWAQANGKETLPVIVVVIDEYADLVESNKRISEPVVRIGQKARAAGIHMIIATQRPSVNVINGVIKANIPSRVALLSSSYVDSNTILDQGGAEKLIGNGDMLIKCALLSNTSLIRCQGAYVSNQEIKAVCDYLRTNYEPEYNEEIMDIINKPLAQNTPIPEPTGREARYGSDEDLYQEVKKFTMSEEFISISRIQTTFSMGYNRASRIFKRMQSEGIVNDDPATNSSKGSRVLIHDFSNIDDDKHEFAGSIEQTTFKRK